MTDEEIVSAARRLGLETPQRGEWWEQQIRDLDRSGLFETVDDLLGFATSCAAAGLSPTGIVDSLAAFRDPLDPIGIVR